MACVNMTSEQFRQFMRDEIEEIQRHKWIESEKVGYDLGDRAVQDWICKFAARYRNWWTSRAS